MIGLSLIDRYLLAETSKLFAAILLVLTAILGSLLFLRTLEEVNVGALGTDLVLRFLGLQLGRDLASLLPPAFFLAVLMGLARLARDSELIALQACGIGTPRLYRALLFLALPVALITAWAALVLKPQAAAGIQEIRWQQKGQAAQIAGLQAGRFYIAPGGGRVVYIGAIDRERALEDIFVLDRSGDQTRLIFSSGGRHRLDEEMGDHLVTLDQGWRFDGQAGSGAYLIGTFERYELRIKGSRQAARATSKPVTLPTAELIHSQGLADRVELEHRLAAPLSIIILVFVAIPLVDQSPRQRTTGRLLIAGLAYFSFFNLQRLAEHWLANGITPLWLTSLWYQPAVLAFVHLLLLPEHSWFAHLKRRLWRGPGLTITPSCPTARGEEGMEVVNRIRS
ncbi:LPS export ABC transporter permease LptF [Caldichromatium japonicum]|uniref:Lipopolysaccharide export system permease protein LptF n=1 Tax=Caldichromatium japonicum TaxID=2699430 RepID=A0A6G7VA56_9GAMM|nr:LPS export ABC transporter permease LptF [Caldichromatium japonicum]QIK36864.1 LPS export ABC transporter permease LptF [Caldichromatium japonicum]